MLGILICTEKYSFAVSPTAIPLLLQLFFAVDEKPVLTRKILKMSIPLSANSQADGKENVLWTTDFGTLTDFSVCLLAFKSLLGRNAIVTDTKRKKGLQPSTYALLDGV